MQSGNLSSIERRRTLSLYIKKQSSGCAVWQHGRMAIGQLATLAVWQSGSLALSSLYKEETESFNTERTDSVSLSSSERRQTLSL